MSQQLAPEPRRLEPKAGGEPAPRPSLWREAPGWRNLMIGASALSAALVVMPWALPPAGERPACNADPGMALGGAPHQAFRGDVAGFLTQDQALRLLEQTQAHAGMSINPEYIDNVRALVHIEGRPPGARSVALVPKGLTVQIGTRVEFIGGYVDPMLPCHYVPNLIARVL